MKHAHNQFVRLSLILAFVSNLMKHTSFRMLIGLLTLGSLPN